jgi:dGTPase
MRENSYFTYNADEQNYLRSLKKDYEDMLSPHAATDSVAKRRIASKHDNLTRSEYAIDIDRIIHSAFYNRGADKTQVFSFFRNDDISRRASHVQLVSRIARIIGRALRLNLDLIEAIAIGHDIGHTPFGHKGEKYLSDLFHENTGKYFSHNVHSVRILKDITNTDLTFQALDGILCHNGEKAFTEYKPDKRASFEELDNALAQCYMDPNAIGSYRPSTLEGCVVRISDIIAYLGKDRQDAKKVKLDMPDYNENIIGSNNSQIITNLVKNIIKRSLGKNYISMDAEVSAAVEEMRKENYALIYQRDEIVSVYDMVVKPMMEKMYDRFKEDFESRRKKDGYSSPLFKHYLDNPAVCDFYQPMTEEKRYFVKSSDEIVTDYIASMTDDYFIDVFKYIFPDDPLNEEARYIGYFDERYMRHSVVMKGMNI